MPMRFSRSCRHPLPHASVTTVQNYAGKAYMSAVIEVFSLEGKYAEQGA